VLHTDIHTHIYPYTHIPMTLVSERLSTECVKPSHFAKLIDFAFICCRHTAYVFFFSSAEESEPNSEDTCVPKIVFRILQNTFVVQHAFLFARLCAVFCIMILTASLALCLTPSPPFQGWATCRDRRSKKKCVPP